MALNDDATLIVNKMRFYLADIGTTAPLMSALAANPATALADWTEIGHTSLENLPEIEIEGGEATTKGSMQNPALRNSYTERIVSLALNLLQFDADTLKLFWGDNTTKTGEWYYAQTKPKPVQKAILAIAEDGENLWGVHAAKGDFMANGSFSLESLEDFAELPVKFSALQHEGAPGYFAMTGVYKKPVTP